MAKLAGMLLVERARRLVTKLAGTLMVAGHPVAGVPAIAPVDGAALAHP